MPGLVTVIGAPGVGKSRLVAESFAQIADRARVLRSRCLPYGDGITYWPVRELVSGRLASGSASLGRTGSENSKPSSPGRTGLTSSATGSRRSSGSPMSRRRPRRSAGPSGVSSRPSPPTAHWSCSSTTPSGPSRSWLSSSGTVLDLGRGPLLLVTVARPELEEAHPDWLTRSTRRLTRLDALDETDASTLLDRLAPDLPLGRA